VTTRFVRLRPSPAYPGARLRLQCNPEDDGIATLAEEDTLPEQVDNPDANHVTISDHLSLTPDDVRWLIAVLPELLAAMTAPALPTIQLEPEDPTP